MFYIIWCSRNFVANDTIIRKKNSLQEKAQKRPALSEPSSLNIFSKLIIWQHAFLRLHPNVFYEDAYSEELLPEVHHRPRIQYSALS